ncbi:MAG: hypothetical protein ACRDNJ_12350 [Solirubrobacteraceae bacterium]
MALSGTVDRAAVPRARITARRAPLIGLAVVALFAGLWGGLIRLGIASPSVVASASEAHGPLMALGFLGTLISLERAVALGRAWAYAAPLAAGLGAVCALAGVPGAFGPALMTLAGVVLLAAHVLLQRIQPSAHNAVMGLGALAWCVAAVMWLAGDDVARFAPLMAGFLVATIVGERLELTRAVNRGRRAGLVLLGAIAVFAAGLAVSIATERLGLRIAGVGLVAQALWLARFDAARRTVRIAGVTRYMAVSLLAGYVWLACGGVLWAVFAAVDDGAAYDAALHAVFLGFVMSMVFAHAPVIVPAVLRVALPFHRGFYVQLGLLHVSVALRLVGGDLAGSGPLWRWGGILNEVAILLFLVVTAHGVMSARRRSAARARGEGQAAWSR